MRTQVEITDGDIAALDRIAAAEGISRAALIRTAISHYLAKRASTDAFGLWASAKVDGVVLQRKLREEW